MSFEVQVWISSIIIYVAALALFMGSRVERRAAKYDREQADADFETVRKALTLLNSGSKEEAARILCIVGERPAHRQSGTTAREFISNRSKLPPAPRNTPNRLI